MTFKRWFEKNVAGTFGKPILDIHTRKSDPPKKRSNIGRKFTFHGRFSSKQEAVNKEQEHKGNFIRKIGKYYYVLRKK